MMARGHTATGAAGIALLGISPIIFGTVQSLLLAIVIGGGYALWPDLDHPRAMAANTFGWISKGIAKLIDKLSIFVYFGTKRRKDANRQGGHRTLTHTFAWAAGSGATTYFLAPNIWANLTIVFIGLCLGLRGLFPKTTNNMGKVVLWITALTITSTMYVGYIQVFTPLQLAIIVFVGSIIHCLGDCLTNSGAPLLWPLPIRGQTWYRFRLPIFSTGSEKGNLIETWIKVVCTMLIVAVIGIRISNGIF